MGMTFTDEWTVLQNILANGGNLAEIDLSAELAKAHALVNNMNAQDQLKNIQNMAQIRASQGVQEPIPNQTTQSMPQEPNVPQSPVNSSNGELNMPPMM